ncbi:MAG: glycosyltransferase family 2 protein [Deltaproteobacteria bacterium]|jgi:GT2 family glycosyltransferase|nr:glycosyltransferase family 2 protein [Deltaproteobacteria bacterium]
MRVSVIIPVRGQWKLTSACLRSLAECAPGPDGPELEVLLVDNASDDSTPAECPDLGRALFGGNFRYLRQEVNLNFAPACNLGARAASGELLFFLNNDTVLTPGWLPPLLRALEGPAGVSVAAPLLLYPKFGGLADRVQHLGTVFDSGLYPRHLYLGFPAGHPLCLKERRFQALTGAALLLRRELFLEAGLFDEVFINGGEDVDLGLRLSGKGHILAVVPQARVYHLSGSTPGRYLHEAHNAEELKKKIMGKAIPDLHLFWMADGYVPALTSNLSLYAELPPRRRNLLLRHLARLDTAEEVSALLEREPLLHEAYIRLAALRLEAGNPAGAVETLYLALSLRPGREELRRLFEAVGEVRRAGMRVEGIAEEPEEDKWPEDKELCVIAASMEDFFRRLNQPVMRELYAGWLARRKEGSGALP